MAQWRTQILQSPLIRIGATTQDRCDCATEHASEQISNVRHLSGLLWMNCTAYYMQSWTTAAGEAVDRPVPESVLGVTVLWMLTSKRWGSYRYINVGGIFSLQYGSTEYSVLFSFLLLRLVVGFWGEGGCSVYGK